MWGSATLAIVTSTKTIVEAIIDGIVMSRRRAGEGYWMGCSELTTRTILRRAYCLPPEAAGGLSAPKR
ncbi:uncharacterized protein PY1_contig-08-271 [Novosphingobium sp. PY1]|nr:uncharacterized protein PY1_contig-08-271 [Novosphingobium sp. PY1]